jgi:hypothetical protein
MDFSGHGRSPQILNVKHLLYRGIRCRLLPGTTYRAKKGFQKIPLQCSSQFGPGDLNSPTPNRRWLGVWQQSIWPVGLPLPMGGIAPVISGKWPSGVALARAVLPQAQ